MSPNGKRPPVDGRPSLGFLLEGSSLTPGSDADS
jgi:hypothetical protein